MFSAGETVTVIRPAARDRVGDRVAGSGDFDIYGCAIIQKSTVDSLGSQNAGTNTIETRETAITTVELLCPAGADIRHGDRVRLGGQIYQVAGLPWIPHNPFTAWEPGLRVQLKGVS